MDSKRLKNKNTGEDIISRLPDDVLTHILSRLEAEDAFKTCVLSSRWKYLWTLIYNFRFQLPFHYEGNHGALFLKFLEHVLCHCRAKNIQEFHIESIFRRRLDCDAARISEWISFAVERNVRSLSLDFNLPMEAVMIRLPQSILTCKSLVRLTLRSWDITLDIPDSVACFPNLKFLSVFARYPDANLMQKLFRRCPVLEELIIDSDRAENENVLTFDITVPTLKKLKMGLSSSFENGVLSHRYVVRAPNLECLFVCDDFVACCVVGETPFLKKLIMLGGTHPSFNKCFNDEANHWATDFFRAISSTRCLSVSSSIMLELSSSTIFINLELPLFPNLIHLDVGIEMFSARLFQFLNNSPNLEVLVLDNVVDDDDDEGDQFEFEGVPSCMLLHLKKVYVTGVDRREARLEVVKFLLENSIVLERLTASFWESKKEEQELQNEILNFPRASPICEIEFVESSYIDKLRHKLYED